MRSIPFASVKSQTTPQNRAFCSMDFPTNQKEGSVLLKDKRGGMGFRKESTHVQLVGESQDELHTKNVFCGLQRKLQFKMQHVHLPILVLVFFSSLGNPKRASDPGP